MERLPRKPIAGESADSSRAAYSSTTPTRRLRSPIPAASAPGRQQQPVGAAFFGETGIVGYFQITKHLSASGGYQVMFVNSVAQPVNQLADTNLAKSTATVDTTQRTVLPRGHGRLGSDVVGVGKACSRHFLAHECACRGCMPGRSHPATLHVENAAYLDALQRNFSWVDDFQGIDPSRVTPIN